MAEECVNGRYIYDRVSSLTTEMLGRWYRSLMVSILMSILVTCFWRVSPGGCLLLISWREHDLLPIAFMCQVVGLFKSRSTFDMHVTGGSTGRRGCLLCIERLRHVDVVACTLTLTIVVFCGAAPVCRRICSDARLQVSVELHHDRHLCDAWPSCLSQFRIMQRVLKHDSKKCMCHHLHYHIAPSA